MANHTSKPSNPARDHSVKTGLILGKFAPLHRGHQRLIEQSLKETDHTIVLLYDCPEIDIPPVTVRRRWIEELYPQVEVLEAWDGPSEIGLDPSITARHDAYLANKLHGRKITHFYSSEPYGEHVSYGLGAIDRRIDMHRELIPISATQIRENPYVHRAYLAPNVYRDLVTHVVFLGAPSTGKTTIAKALAHRFQTVWMPEYGREYWEQNQIDRRLTLEQLVEIARKHREREDRLVLEANRFLFIDTDATTTLHFSYYYHNAAHNELIDLANRCVDRYDLVFLCASDIPYDDTWDRSGEVLRSVMQKRIDGDLRGRKRPYYQLEGPLEERCAQATRILKQFRKYDTRKQTED